MTYDPSDPIWARPNVAAYAAHVQVRTLALWVRKGHISPPNQNGCYSLREIFHYQESWSEARRGRAVHGVSRRGETRPARALAD